MLLKGREVVLLVLCFRVVKLLELVVYWLSLECVLI